MIYLLLIINFIISWTNAVSVGRMWSESKAIGGYFRVLTVAGYIMAICGFTMVYGILALIVAPYIIPLFPSLSAIPVNDLISLTSDMLYVLIVAFIIPSGFIIWFNSVVVFWRRKTIANGFIAGWNSYAQIRNTINAVKHMPSALGRISKALFGGKDSKKNALLAQLAIFILILVICGGWLTASAIMKKADKKYDGFKGISLDY